MGYSLAMVAAGSTRERAAESEPWAVQGPKETAPWIRAAATTAKLAD